MIKKLKLGCHGFNNMYNKNRQQRYYLLDVQSLNTKQQEDKTICLFKKQNVIKYGFKITRYPKNETTHF